MTEPVIVPVPLADGFHDVDVASGAELAYSSVGALRASLAGAVRTKEAAWLQMKGLTLDDPRQHSALCTTLEQLGSTAIPATVVLDWSATSECSAEGMALFSVLGRRFCAGASRVIICAPASRAISTALIRSGLRESLPGAIWVPCAATGTVTFEPVARAAVFGPDANDSVDDFCDDLSAALKNLGAPRSTSRAVTGISHELLHNVLSHSDAMRAAAAALLFPRRRPRVLQIGLADDGVGIADSVLRQERHAWLGWFSDANVTQSVLRRRLSGRADTQEGAESGGGMARMVERLMGDAPARVLMRSGAALVAIERESPTRLLTSRLTFGTGTQFRVEVRLP